MGSVSPEHAPIAGYSADHCLDITRAVLFVRRRRQRSVDEPRRHPTHGGSMFRRIRVVPLLLVAAIGVIVAPSHTVVLAQQTTGAIEGRVVDRENGRPLPSARVTI